MLAYLHPLSSVERRLPVLVAAFLLFPASGLDDRKKPEEELQETLGAIRRESPSPFQEAYEGRKIAGRLESLAGSMKGAPEEWKARLLAASALEGAGEPGALDVRKSVLSGGTPSCRGEAAFAIGFGYFLRERYEIAERYWRILPEIAPDSPWTQRVERFRPYLETLRTGSPPSFRAEFTAPGSPPVSLSRDSLKGRSAVLFFWSSEGLGRIVEVREDSLRNHLDEILSRRGGAFDPSPEVFGVNLDTEREKFEKKMRDLKIPWPEHHDGLGFQGSLVRTFGIPRLPHLLLIGPDGRCRYLGGRLTGKRSLEEALFPPPEKR